MSEIEINNNSNKLIVCFGGMALQMGGIIPFEFLNYLSSLYKNKFDLLFYIDKNQCWYHKGIDGITNNIESTKDYLYLKIKNYNKVIFMGTSAGGYAAILFGSLLNVNYVISFIPQTILYDPIEKKYDNLKNFTNLTTNYILYGDTSVLDIKDNHHISHCENIANHKNIVIIKKDTIDLKVLRDSGEIKKLLDNILENL